MPRPLNIRSATAADADQLSRLVREASLSIKNDDFTDQGWALLESTITADAFRKRFSRLEYFGLVYEVGAEIVGYLSMVDYQKIEHMFVLPGFRNKGISRSLWAAARKNCVRHGNDGDYWVRSSSYAQKIYESFGFLARGERQTKNGISFVYMSLRNGENDDEIN